MSDLQGAQDVSGPFGCRRGILLVVSSPSGAGKTALTRKLREADPAIELSRSVTTRARRENEIDGVHYDFIDDAAFDRLVANEALLEWTQIYGRRYGTRRLAVEAALAAGRDILFDIDARGLRQLAEKMPGDVVSVFILPPSMDELRRRLEGRGTESPEAVAKRIAAAPEEIRAGLAEYQYVLLNEDLERCFGQLGAILPAERLKRSRQTGLPAFAERLLAPPSA